MAACRGRRRRWARAHAVRRCSSRCTACEQRFAVRRDRGEHGAGGVRCGNEVAAQVFWQRADERGDEFLAQSRYLPGELVAAEASQHLDRHVHGDAVVLGARLEPVGQRQRQVARLPRVRLVGGGVVLAQQVVAGHREQVGRLVPLLLPPCVEVPRRDRRRRGCARRRRRRSRRRRRAGRGGGPSPPAPRVPHEAARCRGRSGGGSASRPRRARAG